ncbi:hypothetical protein [Paenibacillus sp. FJAT-26967]|uniref:hypothetical protein n=1 Tax=Paenibacillus sp. FJAT-26967 TaxID=1729690 RepID=UPI000838E23E|nr:hypothetical protein [Paenibacillus sp. FJAT-26967]
MEQDKRALIVKEIEQWRRSKLLPAQYCDFLLNLYMEDGQEPSKRVFGISAKSIRTSHWKFWLAAVIGVMIMSLTLLNFNSFGISLQIGVSAVFVVCWYIISFRQKDEAPLKAHLSSGIASASLIGFGVWILYANGLGQQLPVGIFIALCGAVWLLAGLAGKFPMLQYCGWIGLLVTYGFILSDRLEPATWYKLQLGWLPISFVLMWGGWLIQHRWKKPGVVMLLAGATVWFAPELFGLAWGTSAEQLLQLSLIGKVAAAGVALFAYRKNWTEWVA